MYFALLINSYQKLMPESGRPRLIYNGLINGLSLKKCNVKTYVLLSIQDYFLTGHQVIDIYEGMRVTKDGMEALQTNTKLRRTILKEGPLILGPQCQPLQRQGEDLLF